MSIKTSRAAGTAEVVIDHESCIGCGLCVRVCKGAPLYIEQGKVHVDQSRVFGCIGCGHCMAVCPRDCIRVHGRCLSPDDRKTLSEETLRASYEQLTSLLLARRSVREFSSKEVEQEYIEKIIDAASMAPMGIPPSDVYIMVLAGRDKVKGFSDDLVDFACSKKWLLSPPMLMLERPFMGEEEHELMKSFVVPALNMFIDGKKKGEDWLLYNAPLALFFTSSPYADPADPYIAATYAMVAAESLGLGSCMIGSVAPVVKYSDFLKRKYGLPMKYQSGIVVILGYPTLTYQRALKRTFADVRYY
ncbi:4Fe-4S dicluster domain-containing protein [Heliobacillus mobilis]|uniref:4Fe-4S dicluster domain-containing protein n=1 Tax=Heliobacterium mobile TaxID=28064 RepID=A0A6I3SGP7_HELMO|nr:nitroreductase family protein [Heliobacterium mobile]MTV48003.1 4Fe-4S dicluster domain-containing protein [Heliobacterium mobile]